MSCTVTRKLEFDAAHRVLGHGGKCRHIHGHRYVVELTVEAKKLNDLAMVIDFSVLKAKVGMWIDVNWDHNILLHPDDPLLEVDDHKVFGGKEPYVMGFGNPTAEKIAEELFSVASRLLKDDGITVTNVRVWETPNCHADYFLRTSDGTPR